MAQTSSTQIALDNLKFKVSHRTKPTKPIPASEIPTYDHICVLLRAKFDRVRRTR